MHEWYKTVWDKLSFHHVKILKEMKKKIVKKKITVFNWLCTQKLLMREPGLWMVESTSINSPVLWKIQYIMDDFSSSMPTF